MRSCMIRPIFVVCVLLLSFGNRAMAAPFVNLDFEQATVVPVGGDFIQAGPAFPGWTPRIDGTPLTNVAYNYVGFGEPVVSLFDQPGDGIGLPLLEGRFMAVLVSRAGSATRGSLTQSGDVPSNSVTIRMLADLDFGPPLVRINGVVIPMVLLPPSFTEGSLFAGEVSLFAGSLVALEFLSPQPPLGRISGFDAVEFSPLPIPEPTHALATLAGLTLFQTGRLRSHRRIR